VTNVKNIANAGGNPMTVRSIFLGVAATFALAGAALADHFVYTNNNNQSNTVIAFRVGANGNLTNLGSVPTGGSGCGGGLFASRTTRISINGDLLLAANDCSSNVTVFSGASSGSLVFVALIPFPTNVQGASIASDGKCFVFGSGSSVSSYLFPKLTSVNTVSVGGLLDDMKIGKPGPKRYVAAALVSSNQIAVIPLSPSICALGTVTTIPTSVTPSGGPAGVDFSPKSDILYVGDANIGTKVEAFAFPAGRPLAGSPYTYSTGSDSSTVLASKDGQCLFVANQFSSGVTSIPLSGGVPGATSRQGPADFRLAWRMT
jgi:hypothetical protein